MSAGVRMDANDVGIHTVLVDLPKLDVRSLTLVAFEVVVSRGRFGLVLAVGENVTDPFSRPCHCYGRIDPSPSSLPHPHPMKWVPRIW